MKKIYLTEISEKDDKSEIIKSLIKWEKLEVEFIFDSDFSFSKILRDFMEACGNVFFFPKKILSRLIIVSDELNNNAIEHGSDETWWNCFRLKIEKTWEKIFLNLEVEDNGKWKDSKKSEEMIDLKCQKLKKWFSEHNSIRWRWLFLITLQIVDELYFSDSEKWGLIVWIKKEFEIEKIDS